MKSMHELGLRARENSPFGSTKLGELAVGYTRAKTNAQVDAEMKATGKTKAEIDVEGQVVRAMDPEEVERALSQDLTRRQLVGRIFPVVHYPLMQAYGVPAEGLLKLFPDIELDMGTRTILFGYEQGAFTPYADNGDTATTEG